jgi:hypothetical protein
MLLAYAYLLRIPLLGALLLVLLPVLALSKPDAFTTTFLEGLFDVKGPQHAWVALVALLCASACAVTAELVLRYASLRFHVAKLPDWLCRPVWHLLGLELTRATVINILVNLLCALWFLGWLWLKGPASEPRATTLAWIAVGVVAFFALAFAVTSIWKRSPPALARGVARVFLWSPDGYVQSPEQKAATLQQLATAPLPDRVRTTRIQRVQQHPVLLGGHAFATVTTATTFIIYAIVGYLTRPYAAQGTLPPLPLACLLFLITLIVHVLAGFAFLLDRFRVPTFAACAVIVWIASLWPQADIYFDTLRQPSSQQAPFPHPVRPEDFLKKYRGRAVAVAASGGGIQAAAWMTSVLTQLNDETNGTLSRELAVISSVSGGSTGAMYFLNAYDVHGAIAPHDRTAFEQSRTSSLEDVAWGFLYPDFWRLFVPFLVHWDRGKALENAWTRAGAPTAPLASWRDTNRPAAIFNATLAETGGRLLMSTTDLPPASRGRQDFYRTFHDTDIAVVTAARLSATFPYVSPAPRIDRQDIPVNLAYHVVDGGYFDNFGVASLNDWLTDAIPKKGGELKRLLVVRILGPDPEQDAPAKKHKGFFYQVGAPISTLLSFRTTGQVSRNDSELKLLAEALNARGVEEVTYVTFQYPRPDAPLSWHLTDVERELTWTLYSDPQLRTARQKVVAFLSTPSAH